MRELREAGTAFVVATVVGTAGSTPRKAGAKMIVAGDGKLFGTVGGGAVESHVIERARALLAEPEVVRLDWDLASDDAGGMVCGGRMEFLLEPFGARQRAFVFGAGHVGLALHPVLRSIGFDVTVVDDRADLVTAERFPGARLLCRMPPEAASDSVPPGSWCVIVTRDHRHDLDTLRALVRRDDLRYLGLMSSRRKLGQLFATLEAEGVPAGAVARVRSPVGLAIGAETPEEIAVSVAAEMIQTLRGVAGGH